AERSVRRDHRRTARGRADRHPGHDDARTQRWARGTRWTEPSVDRRAWALGRQSMGIQIVNVSKTYHMGAIEVTALNGVSLEIADGELVAIMGPSGSGKSTLMNILGCLDVPSHGSYRLDGQEVARLRDDQLAVVRSKKIGFVFQQFNLLARTPAVAQVEL